MSSLALPPAAVLHEARRALGIERLVLVVHDSMFPSVNGEDPGRGSPYSKGAEALYEYAKSLGFTGVMFGPQGETSAINQSPYDSTAFSRTVLSIAFEQLARDPFWSGLFEEGAVRELLGRAPRSDGRVHYDHVFHAHRRLLTLAFERLRTGAFPEQCEGLRSFCRSQRAWLERDAEFEGLSEVYGTDDWRVWPVGGSGDVVAAERFAFGQWVVHVQHLTMRGRIAAPDWKIYGDLQIGFAHRDRWRRESFFVPGYAMGAPPSRTDPLGQAWGFPVLDPDSEAVTRFLRERARKMFEEFDGLRIDHPHGLVTPWVYDARGKNPLASVVEGARLLDSPSVVQHPSLARYAIARSDQLDPSNARYADNWVRELDDAQVDRYARRVAILVEGARTAGCDPADIACEVLSTQPYPLKRVMEGFGLGRFVVTQKASMLDSSDVYRSANAAPQDWIMFGNHDTAPLALVLERWRRTGPIEAWRQYLADRLAPEAKRATFARELAELNNSLSRAIFADIFLSRARNVLIFASDLFGLREIYNRPGTVNNENWTLRIPNEFRSAHQAAMRRGDAVDLAGSFALALRAKSAATQARTDLIDALEMGR